MQAAERTARETNDERRSRELFEQLTQFGPDDCPIRAALLAIGNDKWKIVVLLEVGRREEARFRELLRALPDIRTKSLTKALRALEHDGLLSREVFAEIPARVTYRLTERAHLAIPILVQLGDWLLARQHAGQPQ